MATHIAANSIIVEASEYDALLARARLAEKLKRVVLAVGEILFYSWEDSATNEDAAQAMARLREAHEKL